MSLTAVGSIAFDTIETPFGRVEDTLGGSAAYSALAASYFTDVRAIAAVGEDFDASQYDVLESAGVDTSEVPRVRGGRTFRWRGRYEFDMSVAHTEDTELNVFEGWRPALSDAARSADILFLAAMDPETQLEVRREWQGSKWSALDSISFWIEEKPDALVEAVGTVDIVLLNDQEARKLTRKPMLLQAARQIMSWGPRAVVLKLGEYGCALLHEDGYFSLPGYPLEQAADPTGAGDAFAGGFLGYLDLVRGAQLTPEALRRAVTYGSVMASYCAEGFGTVRVANLTDREVNDRLSDFKRMTHFEHVPTWQRAHDEHGENHIQRLEMPAATTGTRSYEQPVGTRGTPEYSSPHRTPSTERLQPPARPLPAHPE